eukprot:6228909-Prymnesium_polylepis.1
MAVCSIPDRQAILDASATSQHIPAIHRGGDAPAFIVDERWGTSRIEGGRPLMGARARIDARQPPRERVLDGRPLPTDDDLRAVGTNLHIRTFALLRVKVLQPPHDSVGRSVEHHERRQRLRGD